jgi:hypothetical protein
MSNTAARTTNPPIPSQLMAAESRAWIQAAALMIGSSVAAPCKTRSSHQP